MRSASIQGRRRCNSRVSLQSSGTTQKMAARIVSLSGTFSEEPVLRSQERSNSSSKDSQANMWGDTGGERSGSRRMGHILRRRPESPLGCCSDYAGSITHNSAIWHPLGHPQKRSVGCIWGQWICWHCVRSNRAIARLVPELMSSISIRT